MLNSQSGEKTIQNSPICANKFQICGQIKNDGTYVVGEYLYFSLQKSGTNLNNKLSEVPKMYYWKEVQLLHFKTWLLTFLLFSLANLKKNFVIKHLRSKGMFRPSLLHC